MDTIQENESVDPEDFTPDETDRFLPRSSNLQPRRQYNTMGNNNNNSIARMNIQTLAKIKIKKKCIMEIWVMCESNYQMHRLSNLYYSHKHNQHYVIPLALITMLSGIMAFSSTSDLFDPSTKQYISLAVGVSAILSSFIQNLGQEAKNDTKAEMHKSATLGMKKIADQLEFEQMQVKQEENEGKALGNDQGFQSIYVPPQLPPPQNGTDAASHASNASAADEMTAANANANNAEEEEEDMPEEKNSIQTYQEMYQQCLESCQSQIPVKIAQAFKLAEARLTLSLSKGDKEAIKEKFGSLGKQTIYRCLYNEVFCAITDYKHFPKSCPDPNEVVLKVMKKVQECYEGTQIDFEVA